VRKISCQRNQPWPLPDDSVACGLRRRPAVDHLVADQVLLDAGVHVGRPLAGVHFSKSVSDEILRENIIRAKYNRSAIVKDCLLLLLNFVHNYVPAYSGVDDIFTIFGGKKIGVFKTQCLKKNSASIAIILVKM
jgi:hypothetical protein